MKNYYPHYYDRFSCIGSDCRDCCCIGWEIDIDSETLSKYKSMDGELGEMLKSSITVSEDGSDCFALSDDERCPFLNENNLCRLIIAGGEEMLCEICHMHPRFREWFGNRCETGLGLCCEEAARIILSDNGPFHLVSDDSHEDKPGKAEELLLAMRDELWQMIADSNDTEEMISGILNKCASWENNSYNTHIHSLNLNAADNSALISSLESLNPLWDDVCEKVHSAAEKNAVYGYDSRYINEYRNLLGYFIFRYFMKAASDGELFLKAALAVFSADAVTYIMQSCDMSFTDSACLWSKGLEYSEENLEAVYDRLYERYAAD